MSIKVCDVMTADVAAVGADTAIRTIADLLSARAISAVPVVDRQNRVLGVVSEADVLRHRFTGGTTADIMSRPARTIHADQPAAAAAQLIERHSIKRLPVVDDLGRLVGIVSRADLVGVVARGEELRITEAQR
jgi:CBS domain-containing protein